MLPNEFRIIYLQTGTLSNTSFATLSMPRARPAAYLTIPVVASFVGWITNWAGVKMMFYPIEYTGVEWLRDKDCPYGFLGWQGVVPARTEKMANRLVQIVSVKLLSLTEAFSHIEPDRLATLLQPAVTESIRRDAPHGDWWAWALQPLLPWALRRVVRDLQASIEECLDLREVVRSAFMRDRRVLVELFQKVGHAELEFLVQSGIYFGFLLGCVQMWAWIAVPRPWTLPLAGAAVGYATNWIAVKLLFEPAEPTTLETPLGTLVLQGLFESRQPEVSTEFSVFLSERVLTSPRLIDELANGNLKERFEHVLRRAIPFVVPDEVTGTAPRLLAGCSTRPAHPPKRPLTLSSDSPTRANSNLSAHRICCASQVVSAAANGLRDVAREPISHPAHAYIGERLRIQPTLCDRLRALSPVEFEDLLHPVFKEDEIILIIVGGVLGATAGVVQMRFGWGGPAALTATARQLRTAHAAKGS